MRRSLCAGLVGLSLLVPVAAQAAACCLSSSAFGVGRLAIWEQFAVMLGSTVGPTVGQWDVEGAWNGNADGYRDTEWRTNLSAIISLHERVQLYGRAPLVVNSRASGDLSETGAGVGDSLVGVRLEPVSIGQFDELPGVAFNVGVTLPSGKESGKTATILASDVTGRGAWAVSAGVVLERATDPWYVQLGGGMNFPLPMDRPDLGVSQRYGPSIDATLAGGWEFRTGMVGSLIARFGYEFPLILDGYQVPSSRAYDLGLGPSFSWKMTPHWTLQASADAGLFLDGLGGNRAGRVTGTLGVRYGYF